ncbi:unnamed protein product [Echinostoma caproni]|uniref:Peptidase M12A domain-containing protein n=1 Tax=Echinostoma caproni TaxID=27848 RepID=A0A183AID9_9TREM|nr:unnamed protein product [Echinostoma caproni]
MDTVSDGKPHNLKILIKGELFLNKEPAAWDPYMAIPGSEHNSMLTETLCNNNKLAIERINDVFKAWQSCRVMRTNHKFTELEITLDRRLLDPSQFVHKGENLRKQVEDAVKLYSSDEENKYYFGKLNYVKRTYVFGCHGKSQNTWCFGNAVFPFISQSLKPKRFNVHNSSKIIMFDNIIVRSKHVLNLHRVVAKVLQMVSSTKRFFHIIFLYYS